MKSKQNHPEFNLLALTGMSTTASSNSGRPDCPPVAPGRCRETLDQRFETWVHTPEGGVVADKFIRLAYGIHKRGIKHYGAQGIAERLRWHFTMMKAKGEIYKINNSYISRLTRFAEQRCSELEGFFTKRRLIT